MSDYIRMCVNKVTVTNSWKHKLSAWWWWGGGWRWWQLWIWTKNCSKGHISRDVDIKLCI